MKDLAPPARYTSTLKNGLVACELCPNRCRIADGHVGLCGVRRNDAGTLVLPFFGSVSSLGIDPIEKKPLYHFHPGSTILSVGFVGCSLHCPFCQNHTISQSTDAPARHLLPEDIVHAAREAGSFGIAYTYSEPLIHFEYVLQSCRLAHEAGLKNVLVTNGYLNEKPALELLPHVDAANVDLKSFDPRWYASELGGKLEPVKRFIEIAAEQLSLEITTLVVPGANDSPAEIQSMAQWIASVDPGIPYHLSCYSPRYRYAAPPTPPELVAGLAEVASTHLDFVYLGNLGGRDVTTACPRCGHLLIRRTRYSTRVTGVREGVCARCGHDPGIPGL